MFQPECMFWEGPVLVKSQSNTSTLPIAIKCRFQFSSNVVLKVEFAPSFLYVGANGKMQFNVGIKWLLDHLNQDSCAGSSQVNVVWGRGPSRGNGRLGLIILPAIGCHCLAHKVEENLNICGIVSSPASRRYIQHNYRNYKINFTKQTSSRRLLNCALQRVT